MNFDSPGKDKKSTIYVESPKIYEYSFQNGNWNKTFQTPAKAWMEDKRKSKSLPELPPQSPLYDLQIEDDFSRQLDQDFTLIDEMYPGTRDSIPNDVVIYDDESPKHKLEFGKEGFEPQTDAVDDVFELRFWQSKRDVISTAIFLAVFIIVRYIHGVAVSYSDYYYNTTDYSRNMLSDIFVKSVNKSSSGVSARSITDSAFVLSAMSWTAVILIIVRLVMFGKRSAVYSRRILTVLIAAYLLRTMTILMTILPSPNFECMSNPNTNMFIDAFGLMFNARQTCGDTFFSGYAVIFTVCLLLWTAKFSWSTSHIVAKIFGSLIIMYNLASIIVLLVSGSTYTVSIFIGVVLTVSLWISFWNMPDLEYLRYDHRWYAPTFGRLLGGDERWLAIRRLSLQGIRSIDDLKNIAFSGFSQLDNEDTQSLKSCNSNSIINVDTLAGDAVETSSVSSSSWSLSGKDEAGEPTIGTLTLFDSNAVSLDPKSKQDMNSLIHHAKHVANRLQNLVEKSETYSLLNKDGEQPAYEELVNRLNAILVHQQGVNIATSQVTAANYVVNMVNLIRNRQLRSLAEKGRKQLRNVRQNVQELEKNVGDLNQEVSVQKKIADRLKSNLDATRSLLQTSITEYKHEMARQREILDKQNLQLNEIFKSKFNQDFILDTSLLATSFYAVNTTLVDYPIQIVALLVGKSTSGGDRRVQFLRQVLKLTCMVYLLKEMRYVFKNYGIHNQVGTIAGYMAHAFMFPFKKTIISNDITSDCNDKKITESKESNNS